jgi:hypothetical protein
MGCDVVQCINKGRMMRFVMALILSAEMAQADPVQDLADAAAAAFGKMPAVVRVDQVSGRCGADLSVNQSVAYCTTRNQIFVTQDAAALPEAAYLVAHAYGHAVQVQHGVADFALNQIRNRRGEEAKLRGLVARQVDCIAGFLVARAGLPDARLADWFTDEPFDGAHWGRDPLRVGPVVSIGLAARDDWFQRGQGGDLAVCAPGEFTSDLLVKALRP